MRSRDLLALLLVASLRLSGQGAAGAPPADAAPKDPLAILKAAFPHYDLSDATLKPWHLKATYQLYDPEGKPTEQGVWEYWWASPKVHRSTLQRGRVTKTIWATADDTVYEKESGGSLRYFERRLEDAVLRPMPDPRRIDAERTKLDVKMVGKGSAPLTCVSLTHQWPEADSKTQAPPTPATPDSYCFDTGTLALLTKFSRPFVTQYSQFVQLQGHYFAKHISVEIDRQAELSVSVESIDGIAATDSALTPAADAVAVHRPAPLTTEGQSANKVAIGSLVKKVGQLYPQMAKAQHIQGTVVLVGTIGTDGKPSDLEVVASPSHYLSEAAVDAVKQWEYKPYLLNGEPVEVETTVNVIFTLGN